MLEIKNLHKSFGEGAAYTKVLSDINLTVDDGKILMILGASGSGKSTLLNVIGGITPADSGSIKVDGQQICGISEKELTLYRRKRLGYVFQRYNLISKLTVKENIETGAWLSKDPHDLDKMIEVLGMKEHKNKLPRELSGGQQQRTAIGRAVIKNPDLLLCDEPTGALDYATSKEILKLITDINMRYGTTVIMVTHNREITKAGDHIVTIKDGKIVSTEENARVSVRNLSW